MNQKLSRLMEPNWKLYFAVLGLYALLAIPFQPWLAAAELAAAIGLYAWFVRSSRARQKKILQYIDSITGSVDTASKSTLINSPCPSWSSGRTPARSSGATRIFCSWRGSGSIFLR